MENNLSKAKVLLQNGDYTCVLVNGNTVYTSSERGVKPLLNWFESGIALKDFSAADKVVGKAAAFLYLLLGVKEVYASVISKPAVEILEENGIKVFCGDLVDVIRNRTNTGFCPMEQATMDIKNPKDAVIAIKETLKKLTQK